MLKAQRFNTFDIDGVIFINKDLGGLHPGPNDVIITGRSYEEAGETFAMLHARQIFNVVFFNHLSFDKKSRASSGHHKASIISGLLEHGFDVGCHFEDDPVQARVIRRVCPKTPVIMIGSNAYTNLENVRHAEY